MRPKVSNKTLTNLDSEEIDLELDNYKTAKMLHEMDNLLEMSLRLNNFYANFPNKTKNTRYCEKTKDKSRSTFRKKSTD